MRDHDIGRRRQIISAPDNASVAVLDHVAERITQLPLVSPRIAIDGPDGAGKTPSRIHDGTVMMLRFAAISLVLAVVGLSSACTATADPPAPTPAPSIQPGTFPDISSYAPVNPDDYIEQLDNPGRPNKLIKYSFSAPDGIQCGFVQPPGASCGGNNLPSIAPAICDPTQGIYRYNLISTSQGVQQWPRGGTDCSEGSPPHKLLPPFHTLTVYGVTCGVDDKGTTACKDPQGRGFVLSPSWSGWIPKV